jgi:hypothetical protein
LKYSLLFFKHSLEANEAYPSASAGEALAIKFSPASTQQQQQQQQHRARQRTHDNIRGPRQRPGAYDVGQKCTGE